MGWLGWSFEQAWFTDINAILIAMEGRMDMLRAIFGGKKNDKPDRRDFASKFRNYAKVHNMMWAKRDER
jgi:hypothetical protein